VEPSASKLAAYENGSANNGGGIYQNAYPPGSKKGRPMKGGLES